MDIKYKTFVELKEAYESGELSCNYPVVIDKDCCFVYDDTGCVFRTGGPSEIVAELLEMLGIPVTEA